MKTQPDMMTKVAFKVKTRPRLGFIGQGWIGRNYADYYEQEGFEVVRYSREQYKHNGQILKKCDIVFVAVPTPTTPDGFDDSVLGDALTRVADGQIAVIKSTVLPGTTEKLQALFPGKIILHSPEFLTEKNATYDARHPKRNIIGFVNEQGAAAAHEVMSLFPDAPYKAIVPARTAELIKYAGNCWFYVKVIYINLLYDLAQILDIDYEQVREALSFDPRIGSSHLAPVHKSGDDSNQLSRPGRGAGGHCFIKDFAAFSDMYAASLPQETTGIKLLNLLEEKNIELLRNSQKDLDLLRGVYGEIG